MRARPAATCVALLVALVLALSSLSLVAPSASAKPKPKRPKPTLAISVSAAEFDAGATPTVTYGWTGLRKRDRLELQYRTEVGGWRRERKLPVTSRNGSASVVVKAVDLGEVTYRLSATYKPRKKRFNRKTVTAETGAVKVFGPVPIADIIRTYPASNADVRRGTTTIGGQPFPYTFARYLTGQNVWRTIVSVPATSCKGWGASRSAPRAVRRARAAPSPCRPSVRAGRCCPRTRPHPTPGLGCCSRPQSARA